MLTPLLRRAALALAAPLLAGCDWLTCSVFFEGCDEPPVVEYPEVSGIYAGVLAAVGESGTVAGAVTLRVLQSDGDITLRWPETPPDVPLIAEMIGKIDAAGVFTLMGGGTGPRSAVRNRYAGGAVSVVRRRGGQLRVRHVNGAVRWIPGRGQPGAANGGMDMNEGEWTDFQRAVYATVRTIPRGKVASYGDVARESGEGESNARNVGNTLRKIGYDKRQPVPWWRVVYATGKLPVLDDEPRDRPRRLSLLKGEGIELDKGDRVPREHFWRFPTR